MDGNGRWAKKRLLPRSAGHKMGVKAVRKLIINCVKQKICALTLFAFSSENWQRSEDEVATLMQIFIEHLHKEIPLFQEHNIKLQIIGDLSKFSPELQQQIHDTMHSTANNTGLVVSVAASYGGRWDITQAAKTLAQQVARGELDADDISEALIQQHCCLANLPEPDLFIRTSGEQRISNFLLWQCAYTELYFTEQLWPDFNDESFQAALVWFKKRQRRFGKIIQKQEA
jgi:undecaprenyl diphosphate synthase